MDMQTTISQICTVKIIFYYINLPKWTIYVQIDLEGVKFNPFIVVFCSFQKEKNTNSNMYWKQTFVFVDVIVI